MLIPTNILVRSYSKNYLDLFWEIQDTTLDVYDFIFTIQRSESPEGPWDTVSPDFTDKYMFRDLTVNLLDKWRQYHYRIKVNRLSDSNVTYSDTVTLEAKPDLIATEVRRQEYLLFREHIGRSCWVFPRRTFGQHCPSCFDIVTGRSVRSKCTTCFDTTYIRGYLDPIQSYVQIDPSPKHIENQQLAKTEQQNTSARMLYYPPVKPLDIIVEAENKRWRVVSVPTTQRLRAVVHQELTLHEIPLGDIEYKLPINLNDAVSFDPSPTRDFTNPHNLEGSKDEVFFESAIAVYGYRSNS